MKLVLAWGIVSIFALFILSIIITALIYLWQVILIGIALVIILVVIQLVVQWAISTVTGRPFEFYD